MWQLFVYEIFVRLLSQILTRTHIPPTAVVETCDPATWTGYDGSVCGDCSAVVNVRDNGGTCEEYCSKQGLSCVDAWDDTTDEQCSLTATRKGCSFSWSITTDAICECSAGTFAFCTCALCLFRFFLQA